MLRRYFRTKKLYNEAFKISEDKGKKLMVIVMESGTISFSEDIEKVLKEIRRISGGDFFSGGGTWGFLWENFLYKTYDKNLNYVTYPFDYRKDNFHRSKTLVGKQKLKFDFKRGI